MNQLYLLYKEHCNYHVTDNVQSIEFPIDIETIREEIFNFIIKNDFGFKNVSLRLPPGQTNYINDNESLIATGAPAYDYINDTNLLPPNIESNKDYTVWHADLENSYLASLVPQLEKLSGFSIGRVRLAWLQPESGYPIHQDFEPLRFHIPLITNSNSYIIHNHKLYHMEYGKLYHIVTTGIHTAWNFGLLPRLHLVFSTYASEKMQTAIDNLSDIKLLNKNFSEHIKGMDSTSLTFLYKIINQSTSDKQKMLHELKAIYKLLT